MEIIEKNISDLKFYSKNSKKHPKEQIDKIKKSILEFGFNNPVLLDKEDNIIAGHGRTTAVIELGWETVPCIYREHLTEEQIIAYRIADNKTAESEWDFDFLKEDLDFLEDHDFDIELTGFDKDELTDIYGEEEQEPEEDDYQVPNEIETNIKLGDVILLGNHRLMCGDSTSSEDVGILMNDEKADMVFTDPPYGNNLGYGRGQLGERYILNDENTDILEKIFNPLDMYLKDNTHCLIWIQWRTFSKIEQIFNKYKLRTVVVWDKKQAGLSGGGFAEQHEWLCVFIKGKTTQNEYSGNVWQEARERNFEGRTSHPHMKPIVLLCKALNLCSKPYNIVLDLFGGSGSTLIAAEQLNRKCLMMELDPKYCEVICERWEKYTGKVRQIV